MTIALGIITTRSVTIIRLANLDAGLAALIAALSLAVLGLAVDAALAAGPTGTVALPFVAAALSLVAALLATELNGVNLWNRKSESNHTI